MGSLKNRANDSEAASFVTGIEDLEQEFETFKMEKMSEIAKKRQTITAKQKEIYDDAKKQGVPKSVVKAAVKSRDYERAAERKREKAQAVLDELESDDRQFAVDIRKVLGDFAGTPLGAAAVEAEEGPDETTTAVLNAMKTGGDEDAAAPKGAKKKVAAPAAADDDTPF